MKLSLNLSWKTLNNIEKRTIYPKEDSAMIGAIFVFMFISFLEGCQNAGEHTLYQQSLS